jgi:hypothetical protein
MSATPERYSCLRGDAMIYADDGEYVSYTDYAELEQENARLKHQAIYGDFATDDKLAELEQAVRGALLLCDEAEKRSNGGPPTVAAANAGQKVLARKVRARLTTFRARQGETP